MKPIISILIATYNRSNNLYDIIKILEKQTMLNDQYEIIITDSFSSDDTRDVVLELQKEYTNIVYKQDCKNILANKRNEGIKLARSSIIVFMDDDVYPSSEGFIENHYRANIDNHDTFFCGQIRFDPILVKQSNYFKFRDDQHLKDDSIGIDLPYNKIVVMNLSFKKEFIDKVGYVDERFINYGCEDTEFGYRIVNNGFRLRYLKDVAAIHREASKSIVEYGRKIAKNTMYGKKTLREVNQQVLKELVHSKFDNKTLINSILFNNIFGNLVKICLLISDRIRLLYNYYLYKYYLFFINYKYIKNS